MQLLQGQGVAETKGIAAVAVKGIELGKCGTVDGDVAPVNPHAIMERVGDLATLYVDPCILGAQSVALAIVYCRRCELELHGSSVAGIDVYAVVGTVQVSVDHLIASG